MSKRYCGPCYSKTAMGISSFPLQASKSFKMLMHPQHEWVTLNNDYFGMSFRIGFYTASCLASKQFNEELWYWSRNELPHQGRGKHVHP